jgi:insulysin
VEGTFDLKEPIYGTEHKRVRVSDEFMKEVSLGVWWPYTFEADH